MSRKGLSMGLQSAQLARFAVSWVNVIVVALVVTVVVVVVAVAFASVRFLRQRDNNFKSFA